jgi:hypothetical protein
MQENNTELKIEGLEKVVTKHKLKGVAPRPVLRKIVSFNKGHYCNLNAALTKVLIEKYKKKASSFCH